MTVDEQATLARRQLAIGFAASSSYFVALLLLPAMVFLNPFVLIVLAYFAGGSLLAALLVGAPLAVVARLIVRKFPQRAMAPMVYFAIGGITATVAFGAFALMNTGQLNPFVALGPESALGISIVIVLAGLCSLGGWVTAIKNTTPTPYEDALGGLDFADLAELIRTSRTNDE